MFKYLVTFFILGFVILTQQVNADEFPLPETKKTKILVLGTYHMANPGNDVFNMKADDVFAEKRQAEIQAIVEALAKFKPTMVALESDYNSTSRVDRFQGYLDSTYELTRNEIDQIGFRLAKNLGHESIYPVDYDWGMGRGYEAMDWDKFYSDYSEVSDPLNTYGAAYTKANAKSLANGTIGDHLRYINSDEMLYANHYFYAAFNLKMGRGDEFIGPDLVANWYKRNLMIAHNLIRLTETENKERILLIIGQGHVYLLNQFLDESPYFERENVLDYLPKKLFSK